MIAVIADDLTGAAELGALALRHGLAAKIVQKEPIDRQAGCVCFNTDSRSCDPPEASRRAAAAAQLVQAASAEWLYKKTDSVLRGNILAELEGIMNQLGFNRALLLPANPSLGRIIRDGRYYV